MSPNIMKLLEEDELGAPTHLDSYNTLQHNQIHCASSISQEQRVGVSSLLNQVKHEPFDPSNAQHKNQFTSPHGLPRRPIRPDNLGPENFRDESFKIKSARMGITPSSRPSNNRISSSLGSGNILKTPPQKKPEIGKRPMETPGSSHPSSKKQKVSESLLDQTIEHLNDVTAVSGVDLREEEEQLFSSPKEDSRESEVSRRVAQEEEERLILNKIPLQKKVVETMAKYGLKNMGKDVERCLSLCVEERLRGLIFNLIRLSKLRAYAEKSQGTIITSDVRQQILSINKKAREEWDKRQAEIQKLQKPSELEDSDGVNIDHKKDESRAKTKKEEDGKMCATAANVAVRAATGAGDMLSRWKSMIEAKQKQVGSDASFSSQPDENVPKETSTTEDQEGEKSDSPLAALTTPASMETDEVPAPQVARRISVRDLLAVLEREPQMSKSELLYRLYNRVSDADAATTTSE